jgi:hypothetical protein
VNSRGHGRLASEAFMRACGVILLSGNRARHAEGRSLTRTRHGITVRIFRLRCPPAGRQLHDYSIVLVAYERHGVRWRERIVHKATDEGSFPLCTNREQASSAPSASSSYSRMNKSRHV